MKRLVCAALALALVSAPALAQHYKDSQGAAVPGYVPIKPNVGPLFTPSNPGKVKGSLALSVFTQSGHLTPLPATTAGATRTGLTAGTVVKAINTGTSAATCSFGASDDGQSEYLSPAGGFFIDTVPTGATQLTCTGLTATTNINILIGTGLGAGG